jgi:hypothetical protein
MGFDSGKYAVMRPCLHDDIYVNWSPRKPKIIEHSSPLTLGFGSTHLIIERERFLQVSYVEEQVGDDCAI